MVPVTSGPGHRCAFWEGEKKIGEVGAGRDGAKGKEEREEPDQQSETSRVARWCGTIFPTPVPSCMASGTIWIQPDKCTRVGLDT